MKLARVGVDLFGRPVHVPLTVLSTLIGGLPGSGKSSLLRVVCAEASFEHDVALALIDPKRVELSAWRPRASAVAVEPDEILVLLERLLRLIDHRSRWMAAHELTEWPSSAEHPSVLAVVDELAELVHSGEKADDRRAVLLRRIVSLGRASGVVVVGATQRPSADVVPTFLRSLFGVGCAFRLRSIEDVRMVLPGVSSDDPGPQDLPAGTAHAGRCYLQTEEETAAREARISWCSPEQARTIAQANAHLRPTLNLDEFTPPSHGAPAATYDRVAGDPDVALLELLADGPQTHQALAAATGTTVDACRKRLARLAEAGRLTHETGSPQWSLAS